MASAIKNNLTITRHGNSLKIEKYDWNNISSSMGGIFYNFNKNNKIVIAADIFPPDIGGPATYSRKLADELVKKNWQVQLICYSDKQQEDKYSFYVNRIIRRTVI